MSAFSLPSICVEEWRGHDPFHRLYSHDYSAQQPIFRDFYSHVKFSDQNFAPDTPLQFFEMSIQLRPSFPGTRKPGFRCYGVIINHPGEGEAFHARSYTARLRGVCKTRLSLGQTFDEVTQESTSCFLSLEESMFTGPHIVPHGQFEWFNFFLPERPATVKIRADNNITRPFFFPILPEARNLPPSGRYGPGNTIEYFVEAVIQDYILGRTIEKSMPFEFAVTREVEDPEPMINTLSQVILIAHRASQSSGPRFTLMLGCATTIIQNHAFHSRLHLPILGTPLQLALTSCKMQLMERTTIISSDGAKQHTVKGYLLSSRNDFTNDTLSTLSPGNDSLDISSVLGKPCVPLSVVPSFACDLIYRTYSLEVSVRLLYKPQESRAIPINVEFEMPRITLLLGETVSVANAAEEEYNNRTDW